MPTLSEPNSVASPLRRVRAPAEGRVLASLVPWLIATIAACWLYFGRTVLIPITLAIFLSFLLAPVVAAFRRAGLPRRLSVLLALALGLSAIGITGAVIVTQAATLSADVPAYAERITQKAASLSARAESKLGALTRQMPPAGAHWSAQRLRSPLRRLSCILPFQLSVTRISG